MKISVFIEDKGDIHHIANVMRHQEGNHIIVTFNNQSAYTCRLLQLIQILLKLSEWKN